MKKKILTVTMALGLIYVLSEGNSQNEVSKNSNSNVYVEKTNCYSKKQTSLKAGITPPIIRNPRPYPKKMYEAPASFTVESHKLA